MRREVVCEGPSIEEAIDMALSELGVQQDAVDYEVLEEPGRKIFGMGSGREAKVRVWLKPAFVSEVESAKQAAREILEDTDVSVPESKLEGVTNTRIPSVENLSEEDLDRVADAANDTIEAFINGFGIQAEVEEYEGDDDEIILDIVGSDLAVLIGRHGRTLDSIQVLTSAITNKRLGFRYPVTVDVEGYRNRRRVKLEEVGLRAASRAARQDVPVRLRPMSALERRVVHMVLRDDPKVTTSSEGEDPNRAVVVYPNRR